MGILVRDLLHRGNHILIDIGLGKYGSRRLTLATRVIPFDGYLMTGGAGLPVTQAGEDKIGGSLSRILVPTDLRRLTPDQETDLTALIIRTCLESGMGSRIAYGDPDQPTSPRTQTRDAAVSGRRIETTRVHAGAAGNTKPVVAGARFGRWARGRSQ